MNIEANKSNFFSYFLLLADNSAKALQREFDNLYGYDKKKIDFSRKSIEHLDTIVSDIFSHELSPQLPHNILLLNMAMYFGETLIYLEKGFWERPKAEEFPWIKFQFIENALKISPLLICLKAKGKALDQEPSNFINFFDKTRELISNIKK